MLVLEDLAQLAAFADCGTLTRAAESLHISQPTITRTMQRLEDAFGVPLFERGKNRIALNETGRCALELSRRLLDDAEGVVRQVRQFDRSRRTVTIFSCAPAPLWVVLPAVSEALPGLTLTSTLTDNAGVLRQLTEGGCTAGILTGAPPAGSGFAAVPFLQEALSVSAPEGHALAGCAQLTFAQMNGYNFLLYTRIGFWEGLCREKMPASRFLMQDDEFAMEELTRASSLPRFVTNLSAQEGELPGRRRIPIADPEATVTYYLAARPEQKALLDAACRLSKQKPAGPALTERPR